VINGDKWGVSAGTLNVCEKYLNRFDVLLNLTYKPVRQHHKIPIPELKRFERIDRFVELLLDWPDMGVTRLSLKFWQELIKWLQAREYKMLVCCVGGHGRTGTAIASLMVAMGSAPEDAIDWVHDHYCRKAIETQGQQNYIINLVKTRKE